MGKASSTKKVARAAKAAGGKAARRRSASSWLWPGSLVVVVLLGLSLIVISRGQSRPDEENVPPTFGDHWHAALAFYDCEGFLPPQSAFENPQGLHSHGDGLIHLHPFSNEVTGNQATLGKYLDLSDITLTSSRLNVPGRPTRENGDRCGTKPGKVQVKVNDQIILGDPRNVKLADQMRITVAFAPEGKEIPDPPWVAALAAPSDLPAGQASTTTTPQ
jgi:hypothetical protein